MTDVITCPSGLTGRVRGMKVRLTVDVEPGLGSASTSPGATWRLLWQQLECA